MTSLLDGVAIDLDRVQIALDGSEWLWTCELTESGQPLMQRLNGTSRVLPLSEVYGQYGPIAASPKPVTSAMCRRVLEAS